MKAKILTVLFKSFLWLTGARPLKIDWKQCDYCKDWVNPCGECQEKLDKELEKYNK